MIATFYQPWMRLTLWRDFHPPQTVSRYRGVAIRSLEPGMGAPVMIIRDEFTAAELRLASARCTDGAQVRRMLALAPAHRKAPKLTGSGPSFPSPNSPQPGPGQWFGVADDADDFGVAAAELVFQLIDRQMHAGHWQAGIGVAMIVHNQSGGGVANA